jgi:hypothetical protein
LTGSLLPDVFSWRLATALEADSCVEALEEAMERMRLCRS